MTTDSPHRFMAAKLYYSVEKKQSVFVEWCYICGEFRNSHG